MSNLILSNNFIQFSTIITHTTFTTILFSRWASLKNIHPWLFQHYRFFLRTINKNFGFKLKGIIQTFYSYFKSFLSACWHKIWISEILNGFDHIRILFCFIFCTLTPWLAEFDNILANSFNHTKSSLLSDLITHNKSISAKKYSIFCFLFSKLFYQSLMKLFLLGFSFLGLYKFFLFLTSTQVEHMSNLRHEISKMLIQIFYTILPT